MDGLLDVLPTIFSKLTDEFQTLCKMPLVSKSWYDAYHNVAFKMLRAKFDRYLKVVNVPLEKFEDLCGLQYYYVKVDGKLGQIQDDQDDPVDFDCEYDDEEQLINWEYPFNPKLPVDIFKGLISEPDLLSTCFTSFTYYKKMSLHISHPCTVDHMCWLSLDGQQNYFTTPQEWFPIYQPFKTYVSIGVNVRTGQFGIYYNAEENGYNFIIPKTTAYDIMRNRYGMEEIGNKLRDLGSDGIIVKWNSTGMYLQ
uniref:Uncharacterized protein n=1 Tax=Clandestinovirus TaxID=2831644 RepID=A0A8F8PN62_9VIRU|nr:hypothetical protein KOM_12_248 [Clandestinovirus]